MSKYYLILSRFLPLAFVFLLMPGSVIADPDNDSLDADPSYSITGFVQDATTGDALAGAHVFVLESTVGTITDGEGRFNFTDLSAGSYRVGVSMLGYKPHILEIDTNAPVIDPLEVRLAQQVYEMKQVTVTGKRDRRWKKQLKKFELEVIGDSENAQKTHIVNPEVLNFIQRKGVLIAQAYEPLIIENKALGYRIHYDLVHCSIQHDQPQYKGVARFEEMEPENNRQRRRWERNRKLAYEGSFKHLLHTLASGASVDDLKKEGFFIALTSEFPSTYDDFEKAMRKNPENLQDLVLKSDNESDNMLRFNKYLLITYSEEFESNRYVQNHLMHTRKPNVQRSSVELRADQTLFNEKGYLYDTYSVVLHGYMGWERMAEMLPLDYEPVDG